eukprot:m.185199 g.185199  ORF g.185199 m.185199 type:complete len:784 (-) comp16679_c15_seq2:147-2498(-)
MSSLDERDDHHERMLTKATRIKERLREMGIKDRTETAILFALNEHGFDEADTIEALLSNANAYDDFSPTGSQSARTKQMTQQQQKGRGQRGQQQRGPQGDRRPRRQREGQEGAPERADGRPARTRPGQQDGNRRPYNRGERPERQEKSERYPRGGRRQGGRDNTQQSAEATATGTEEATQPVVEQQPPKPQKPTITWAAITKRNIAPPRARPAQRAPAGKEQAGEVSSSSAAAEVEQEEPAEEYPQLSETVPRYAAEEQTNTQEQQQEEEQAVAPTTEAEEQQEQAIQQQQEEQEEEEGEDDGHQEHEPMIINDPEYAFDHSALHDADLTAQEAVFSHYRRLRQQEEDAQDSVQDEQSLPHYSYFARNGNGHGNGNGLVSSLAAQHYRSVVSIDSDSTTNNDDSDMVLAADSDDDEGAFRYYESRPRNRSSNSSRSQRHMLSVEQELEASIIGEHETDEAYDGEQLLPSADCTTADFVQAFHAKHPLSPLFLTGTFTEALSESARLSLPLLIYLHDDRSPRNSDFAQMLCDPAVVSVITSYFVVFGYDFTYKEARKRLLQEMKETADLTYGLTAEFPCLVVLARVNGLYQMTKCLSDFSSADEMASALEMEGVLILSQALENSNASVSAHHESQAAPVSAAQQLRDEQDAAYQRSLEEDRRREREQQEAAERERQLAEAEEQRKQAEQDFQDALKQQVRPEPSADSACLTIRLRTPDGKTTTRRFLKDTTVAELEAFVGSLGFLPTDHRLRFPQQSTVPEDDKYVSLSECVPTDKFVITVEAS